jgi:hypothetical protein
VAARKLHLVFGSDSRQVQFVRELRTTGLSPQRRGPSVLRTLRPFDGVSITTELRGAPFFLNS